MTSDLASHPAHDDLTRFALGRLDGDAELAVERHLGECETCLKAAAQAPADSFVSLLRSATQFGDTSIEAKAGDVTLSDAEPTDSPPELPGSRYRPIRLLGRGGMGAVWLAEHRLMGREVAVKVIHAGFLRRPGAAQRFRQEVQAAARLQHPNIVTAFDADEAGDAHLLAMEYVEGVTFAEEVRSRGALPADEACDAARQAALGLQHAHERGLVHRDIKPANLMRTPGGVVKILDFGLAVLADTDAALTGANVVLGTPDYIAPEQAEGSRNADARSDVYSLGCTLYHLLSGGVPFPADSVLKKLDAQRRAEPKPLTGVPRGLAAVVARMMAKDPARRYQTAAEVAAALEPFTRAIPPKRDRRSRLLLATMMLSVLLAAGVVLRIQTDEGEVVITPHSPDVEVVLLKGGKEVRIIDTKTDRRVTLPVGTYDVALKGKRDGLEVRADRVTVRRGEEVLVAIERVNKAAGPPAPPSPPGEVWRDFVHEGRVYAVAFLPGDRFVSCGADHRIVRRSAKGNAVSTTYGTEVAGVSSIAVSADGKTLVSTAGDNIRVWTLKGYHLIPARKLEQVTEAADAVALSPDGRYAAGSQGERGWKLWEATTGQVVHAFPGSHTGALVFSPDGKFVLDGGKDGEPRLWEIATRKRVKGLRAMATAKPKLLTWIHSVAFSPDGHYAFTGHRGVGEGPTETQWGDLVSVVEWRIGPGKERLRLVEDTFRLEVRALAVTPDGKRLVAGGADGKLKIYRLSDGKQIASKMFPSGIECVAVSPDSGSLLVGNADGQVALIRLPGDAGTP